MPLLPRHRSLLGLGVAVLLSACQVGPFDFSDKACDVEHACDVGTCFAGRCVAEEQLRLTWAPPILTDPVTVSVSDTNRSLNLNPAQDYVIEMPDTPLRAVGGLTIAGGNDVVLIGGTIEALPISEAPAYLDRRGLYLKNQTGTVHIEGLLITGAELAAGINMDQREGAIVQLQNVRIETARVIDAGRPRILHTWGGPRRLHIDRLTGFTEHQGFLLEPNLFETPVAEPEIFDFRNLDVHAQRDSGTLYSRNAQAYPLALQEVWAVTERTDPSSYLWPPPSDERTDWRQVKHAQPPGPENVPAGVAGTSYVSPGYL